MDLRLDNYGSTFNSATFQVLSGTNGYTEIPAGLNLYFVASGYNPSTGLLRAPTGLNYAYINRYHDEIVLSPEITNWDTEVVGTFSNGNILSNSLISTTLYLSGFVSGNSIYAGGLNANYAGMSNFTDLDLRPKSNSVLSGFGKITNTTTGAVSALWDYPAWGQLVTNKTISGVYPGSAANVMGTYHTVQQPYTWRTNLLTTTTNTYLLSVWSTNSNDVYKISAFADGGWNPSEIIFSGTTPYYLDIIEKSLFVNTVTLSAARNSVVEGPQLLTDNDIVKWISPSAMLYTVLSSGDDSIMDQTYSTEYSGYGNSAFYVQISSSHPSQTFPISATVIPFLTQAWSTSTTDIYVWDYTKVITDEFTITEENKGNNFAEIATRRYVNSVAPYWNVVEDFSWGWGPDTNVAGVSTYNITTSLWETYSKDTIIPPSGALLRFETDAETNLQYTISSQSSTRPAITASYDFTTQFDTTQISAIVLDSEATTRVETVTTKAYALSGGINLLEIHPDDLIKWNVSTPVGTNVWITRLNGSPLTLGSPYGPETTNTIIYNICAIEDNIAPIDVFNVTLSAQVLSAGDIVDIDTIAYETTAWPGPGLFDPQFNVDYNLCSSTNILYKISGGSTYTVSVSDLTYIDNPIDVGSRIWDFGDGTIITTDTSPQTHIYTLASLPNTFTITMTALTAQSVNWDGVKTKPANCSVDLTIVDEFLSADYISYPSRYFNPDMFLLGSGNYTNSQGLCSYGEGHTETINLSAYSNGGTTYKWTIGDDIVSTSNATTTHDIPSVAPQSNVAVSGVRLDVYNSAFIDGMDTYYVDIDGSVKKYPNIAIIADDSNKLFQNLRIYPYETPTANIHSYDVSMLINTDNVLNASVSTSHGTLSPVETISGNYTWQISTANWVDWVNQTSPDLLYTLNIGNGLTATSVSEGGVNVINVSISGTVTDIINDTPYDWVKKDSNLDQVSISTLISAYVIPDIEIYTPDRIQLIDNDIIFYNESAPMPPNIISGFFWDMGDDTIVFTEDYQSVIHSYSQPDVYSLTLSAVVVFDDSIIVKEFSNYITVLSAYDNFDDDIIRVYGEQELVLPHSLQDVELPPNEWVTSDNINNMFDKLNANLDYLDNVSKLYAQPPISFEGWYGETLANGTRWYDASSNSLSTIISGGILSAVNDVVVKDNLIYIANDTTVQILSSNRDGSLIGQRSIKSIGDPFISLQSIDVDDDNRIYVLDKPKNRVAVYSYTEEAYDQWKLLYSWGALGGASVPSKFQNPNDMVVDSNNMVWVTDTDNFVIKKFTRSGSWLKTITSDYLNADNKPLSVAIDEDNNLHILTNEYIIKTTNDGEHITNYGYNNSNGYDVNKIVASDSGGFLYIILSGSVIKVNKNGLPAGTFAGNNGTVNYAGGSHSPTKGFYIANGLNILKYYDYISIVDDKVSTDQYTWDMDNIYIESDEYVQDWVYNKSISRMWDNIEIFRRSIKGKIISTTTDTGTTLSIQGFTPQEYKASIDAVIDKENIFIGINEFVTADVVNRCVGYLYEGLNNILELLE